MWGHAVVQSVVPAGSSRLHGSSSSMYAVSLTCVSPLSQLSVLLECAIFSYYLSSCSQANYYFYNHFGWTLNLNVGSSFPFFAWSAIALSLTSQRLLISLPSFLPSPFPFFWNFSPCAISLLFFLFQSSLSNLRVSGTTFKTTDFGTSSWSPFL